MRTVDCYTMQIELLGVLVNAIVMITGTKACDNSLCFWWTMKTDRLKLTCKIRFLHYSVTILNPLGEEELSCIPPLQYSKCHAAHGIAEQNLKTNETIVTVWDISSKYNGNWTCLHGFGTGSASVEVFLTSVSGLVKENGNKCIWEFLSWTLIGLLPTFMILRIVTWMCFNRIKDTNLYKTYSHKIKDSIKNVYKRIAYMSMLLYLFGMTILIGAIERGNCTASETFIIVGAIMAVTLNLLSDDKKEESNSRNNVNAQEEVQMMSV